PLMAQHGRKDEPTECRLGEHGLLGFTAHLGPDRIDLGDLTLGLEPGGRCHVRSPARVDVGLLALFHPALTSARPLVNVELPDWMFKLTMPAKRTACRLIEENTWDHVPLRTRPKLCTCKTGARTPARRRAGQQIGDLGP